VTGVALLATAAVIAGFLVLGALIHVPFEVFSRDASAVLDGPFYVAYLSHLESLVWCLAAAVALFTSVVVRRAGNVEGFRLLLAAAGITGAMALDDLLLLHEGAYPVFGISEVMVYGVYGILIAAFVVTFRRRLGHAVLPIGVTLALWVVSAGVDLLVDESEASFVLEDGFKAAGVAVWVVMLVGLAWAEITTSVPAGRGPM
jgi:hypothetical protein